MVIRKMNNVLVKHNKILFGIFSFVIIVAFVWFFTPGLDGSLLFGKDMSSPNAVVGTVFGKKITNKEYRDAYRSRLMILSAITGRDSYQFHEYIEKTLLDEIARENAAKFLGITATDKELENFIRNGFAVFRGKDGFDPELYKKFAEDLQKREGYSIIEFEEMVRNLIGSEKLASLLTADNFTTPDELHQMAVLQKEKFNASMIEFPYASYLNKKKITEENVLNYYKSNPKLFMTEAMIRAEVIKFPFKQSPVMPSEHSIQVYYKAHAKDYTKDGKVQPLAAVKKQVIKAIQIETGKQIAIQQAKKFRDAIYDAAAAGSIDSGKGQLALFHQIAAKMKLQSIQTGWFTLSTEELKGIGKEPMLVAELFKTNPKHNPLLRSAVISTNAAYVGASLEQMPSKLADFKDVKAKAQVALAAQDAKMAAREAAFNFMHQIMALGNKTNAQVLKLAEKSGAKVTSLKGFSRETKETSTNKQFAMQQAARLTDKTISNAEEGPDSMILVWLDSHVAPTAAEIKDAEKNLQMMIAYTKQMLQQNSMTYWFRSNIHSNLRQDEQSR